MSLKARIDRLYNENIGAYCAEILVTINGEVIAKKVIGDNPNKVIKLVIRF